MYIKYIKNSKTPLDSAQSKRHRTTGCLSTIPSSNALYLLFLKENYPSKEVHVAQQNA